MSICRGMPKLSPCPHKYASPHLTFPADRESRDSALHPTQAATSIWSDRGVRNDPDLRPPPEQSAVPAGQSRASRLTGPRRAESTPRPQGGGGGGTSLPHSWPASARRGMRHARRVGRAEDGGGRRMTAELARHPVIHRPSARPGRRRRRRGRERGDSVRRAAAPLAASHVPLFIRPRAGTDRCPRRR